MTISADIQARVNRRMTHTCVTMNSVQ